jgi:hypothetical protein
LIIRRLDAPRPVRALNLAAKLKDAANAAAPELSFQRKALQDFQSRQTKVSQPSHPVERDGPLASLTLDSYPRVPRSINIVLTQNKRPLSSITINSGDEGAESQTEQHLSLSRP